MCLDPISNIMFRSLQMKGIIAMSLISSCICQYYQNAPPQYRQPPQSSAEYYREPSREPPPAPIPYEAVRSTTPSPQIIMHKQAQSHDGGFKYAFAAENGLAQGEAIAPDGTRTGGYTYIDPNGKKISVKYTAGKDGFKILEGDHIPRAPAPVPAVAAAARPYVAPAPKPSYTSFPQPANDYDGDDGQYRPERYEKERYERPGPGPAPALYTNSYAGPRPQSSAYTPARYTAPVAQPESNSLEDKDYFDEPGKPHSFGKGFSFEFVG